VAKRKQDLAGKLTPERRKLPGWEDTVSGQAGPQSETRRPAFVQEEPETEPANKLKRKTYLLYPGMIEEIETIAEQERVGINELVRYLLGLALDQVYHREVEIPTQPGRRRIEQ
jgi:hypothetical protein